MSVSKLNIPTSLFHDCTFISPPDFFCVCVHVCVCLCAGRHTCVSMYSRCHRTTSFIPGEAIFLVYFWDKVSLWSEPLSYASWPASELEESPVSISPELGLQASIYHHAQHCPMDSGDQTHVFMLLKQVFFTGWAFLPVLILALLSPSTCPPVVPM